MCDNGGGGSKRQEVKILLRRLRRDNPNIERSIFNSIHAVNLDMMPGYKSGGVLHSFLDDYDERGKKKRIAFSRPCAARTVFLCPKGRNAAVPDTPCRCTVKPSPVAVI